MQELGLLLGRGEEAISSKLAQKHPTAFAGVQVLLA